MGKFGGAISKGTTLARFCVLVSRATVEGLIKMTGFFYIYEDTSIFTQTSDCLLIHGCI